MVGEAALEKSFDPRRTKEILGNHDKEPFSIVFGRKIVWPIRVSLAAKKGIFFVAAPRTSLAGLLSTVTALPCTDYKIEMLESLLSA